MTFGHIRRCIIDEADERLGGLPSGRIIRVIGRGRGDHDFNFGVLFEVDRFTRLEQAVLVDGFDSH